MKAVGILAKTAADLLLVVGLFSNLVLPGLIERRLALICGRSTGSKGSLKSRSPSASRLGCS